VKLISGQLVGRKTITNKANGNVKQHAETETSR